MAGRVLGSTLVMLVACSTACAQETPGREAAHAATCALSMIDVQQRMPASVEGNEPVPVEIQVANNGPVAVDNVMLLETLPASAELIDATPPPEQLRGKLAWPLGTLAPGGQSIIRLRLRLKGGAPTAELRNTVTVVFQTSVSHSAATVVKRPLLALEVTGPKSGSVGETLSCLITASNRGNTVARQLRLETRLAAGLSHPVGADLEYQLGDLAPGESRAINLPVKLAKNGDLPLRVRLVGNGAAPVDQELVVRAHEIRLTLVPNGPKILCQNWPGSFELAVRNDGSEPVRQVGVMVGLPDGVAFSQANHNGRYDPETHAIYWSVGDIRPGESHNLLWVGVAKRTGELVGRATLQAGQRPLNQVQWTTTVTPESSAAPGPDLSWKRAGDRN